MSNHHIIERAFGLARSGTCADIAELGKLLRTEGFAQVAEHLSSPSLRRQLRDLCAAHRNEPASDG
jgi:hypothetical protein